MGNDLIMVTLSLIKEGNSRNKSLNYFQCDLIGVPLPLASGWMGRSIGNLISRESKDLFLKIKNMHLDSKAEYKALYKDWKTNPNPNPNPYTGKIPTEVLSDKAGNLWVNISEDKRDCLNNEIKDLGIGTMAQAKIEMKLKALNIVRYRLIPVCDNRDIYRWVIMPPSNV